MAGVYRLRCRTLRQQEGDLNEPMAWESHGWTPESVILQKKLD